MRRLQIKTRYDPTVELLQEQEKGMNEQKHENLQKQLLLISS